MAKALTEVVSFRASRELLDRLERLARKEMRSRGNQIMVFLTHAVAGIESTTKYLEWLVKTLHEEEQRNPDSPQAEYFRGELHATKAMLALFCGERVKAEVLQAVRRRTGLPIPHIVSLAEDGKRYGFDLDAG